MFVVSFVRNATGNQPYVSIEDLDLFLMLVLGSQDHLVLGHTMISEPLQLTQPSRCREVFAMHNSLDTSAGMAEYARVGLAPDATHLDKVVVVFTFPI